MNDLVSLWWCECTHGEGVHFFNEEARRGGCVMCDTCDGFKKAKETIVPRSSIRATAKPHDAPESAKQEEATK